MYDRSITNLIVTVVFGLLIAYFATQNTAPISLNFLQYQASMPTYVVLVGALLVGLIFSWMISLVNDIGTGFTLRGKENKIKDYKAENAELLKQVHQLQLENTKIKAETHTPVDDKSL